MSGIVPFSRYRPRDPEGVRPRMAPIPCPPIGPAQLVSLEDAVAILESLGYTVTPPAPPTLRAVPALGLLAADPD